MSRPRFLADHDLNDAIVLGTQRRQPSITFVRVRDIQLAGSPDESILEYAAVEGLMVVSHDVNTMTAQAGTRIAKGLPMPGLFVAHQADPIGAVIEDLVLIWSVSDSEEWANQIVFLPIQ